MFARHPKTGAPIRILTAEGTIWRDSKTLVWLCGDEPPAIWNRWEVGVSSLAAWEKVSATTEVDVCVLLGDLVASHDWIRAGNASSCRVVAVPKSLIEHIGMEALRAMEIANMVCLDEIHSLYPFLGAPWDGSEADARILAALLLQYKRTFPVADSPLHAGTATELGLAVSEAIQTPPPLILLAQYFQPPKAKRAKEIAYCLKKNVECPYVDRIVLLNEAEYKLPVDSSKIQQVFIGERLRFDHVLRWIRDEAPADAIVAVANSDIYLDDTWRQLWSVNLNDKFLSLLRWDDQEDPTEPAKLFGPRPDSQDTWVMTAASVKARNWNWEAVKIPFGKGGCDNAFNVEMLKQRFLVVNPCMSLKTHHVHMSGLRTYDPLDIIEKPIYMHLNPTGIHDLRPILNIVEKPLRVIEEVGRPIPLRGASLSESQRATFVRMITKAWPEFGSGSAFPAANVPIYEFKNISQTHTGLLHTYNSILVGKSKTASDAWSEANMSVLAAHLELECALVAYLPDSVAACPYRYMLQYLGKILALREAAGGDGEWLANRGTATVDALKLFAWPDQTMPVVARSPNYQVWCKKAYAWFPQDGLAALSTGAEVAALRKGLRGWVEEPIQPKRRLVCIVDSNWVTDEFVESLEKELTPTVEVTCIYPMTDLGARVAALQGAWGVVVLGGKGAIEHWGLLWALPVGARVWDIQVETAPTLEVLQLATVSNLKHFLCCVPRPVSQAADRHAAFLAIARSCFGEIQNTATLLSPVRHRLILPNQTEGRFAHAGDSFREMAAIWGERGYIDIVHSDTATQVWLNGVGDTLLYDRPTLEWLRSAPEVEQVWRKGLFGNPAPPPGGQAWSFWPRRPKLVEELVSAGTGSAGWSERSQSMVFYGRSENLVQRARRVGKLWVSSCSDFVHLDGEKPYPYSHKEYLEKLADARLGLCLAGYGNKCHREVECMAMGCVPVVAAEVDMTNYADPPMEGVHFFHVKSPEEANQLVTSIDEATWMKMSNACKDWWRRNASAEGMWELTKRLAGSP